MTGKLFVISAPSGTGKTTVIKRLLSKMPEMKLAVSLTTRSPRAGEKDGVDYIFVPRDDLNRMIKAGEMLEWANVHGNLYGTPRPPIDEWLKDGKNVLLDIDVQGAASVKKLFKEAVLIFLLPPSKEELVKRITQRGANKEDDLKLRLKNAEIEMAKKDIYDHQVVNDELERAVEEILNIIRQ